MGIKNDLQKKNLIFLVRKKSITGISSLSSGQALLSGTLPLFSDLLYNYDFLNQCMTQTCLILFLKCSITGERMDCRVRRIDNR